MAWLIHDPLTRFLIQVVVIIAACRGLGLLARWMGQPAVIAEVGAGIVLGPSLLGWVSPGTFHDLFPVGSLGVVRTVSQLGLLLFMFLVGLELDLRLLRGRARTSIAVAQVGILVPFGLGAGVAWWLRDEMAPPGVAFPAYAMFVGVAMSITAFPVLARLLSEQRLLRTRVGTVAVAAAAIGDVTAWCLLAFATAMARPRGVSSAIVTTVLAVAYVGVMLLVVRPLLARVAARVTTPGAMSQNLVALVLLLVIVSSLVTERIGVHLLFGAFLVGVVLPKEGGFARAIAEKLEDVVVLLLLPLFFAVSGLRTEIGLVGSPHQLSICAVIILVATVGKLGGGALAARLSGMGWREAGAIGVLMNTRGLMELIVLNIGLELGVITPAMFSMLVIMALVTTFATAPLLRHIYPPSVMAQDLLRDAPAKVPASPSVPRVMVCVSHDHAGPGLVSMAKAIAGDAGEVVALHLASPAERASARFDQSSDDMPGELAGALARGRELGVAIRPLSFVSTDLAEDIARVADVRDIDVTLLGLHKPILSQTLLGGVIHDAMQRVSTTVAVFVERGAAMPKRVLVPFQGSPHDRAALSLAQKIQRSTASEVVVLNVVRPGERRDADEVAEDAVVDSGGRVIVETVEHRSPADAALARASAFDLVVVGVGSSWGLGERKLGFGLQSERLIRDCPTSLLVVRAEQTRAIEKTAGPALAPARIASE